MTPVTIPWTDVNSDTATVVAWHVPNRSTVTETAGLVDIETSKAALEIPAPATGFVLQVVDVGAEIEVGQPVAYIFDDEGDLAAFETEREQEVAAAPPEPAAGVRASEKALKRAEELGVDVSTIRVSGLVTVKDVEAAAGGQERAAKIDPGDVVLLSGDPAATRLLLIGAGLGATQVLDILAERPEQAAVGIVDDDSATWGSEILGVPVVGGSELVAALHGLGGFDAVVVAISTSVDARARLRGLCEQAGVPLANVIDPRVKLATGVTIGTGNVICAYCHFGTETRIGDNNFISAYNSYDHHNVLGNDISTGPGCMTSGEVTLEDRVRLGTGVFVEPKLVLGEGALVASGAIVVTSVPAHHAVKTKVVTTTVVPVRQRP
jgi:acetyltransferase-like isoleucine patch superfamily enzyme